MNNFPVFVFDVDGTLTSERFENDQVRELKTNPPILNLALALQENGLEFVVVTARPEYLREDTEYWIAKQGLKPSFVLMRKEDDKRPDPAVRSHQLKLVRDEYGPHVLLFDDKIENCQAVKSMGIPCIHVKQ